MNPQNPSQKTLRSKINDMWSSIPTTMRWVVGSIATGIALLLATDALQSTIADRYLSDIDNHKKTATAALATAKISMAKAESLSVVVIKLQQENVVLKKSLDKSREKTETQKKTVDTTLDLLKTQAKTTRDSLSISMVVVSQQSVVIDQQENSIAIQDEMLRNYAKQVAHKDSVIAVVVASNEELERVVRSIPVPNKCDGKFLFCKLNKPTRTTSFLAGVGTSLLTLVILR